MRCCSGCRRSYTTRSVLAPIALGRARPSAAALTLCHDTILITRLAPAMGPLKQQHWLSRAYACDQTLLKTLQQSRTAVHHCSMSVPHPSAGGSTAFFSRRRNTGAMAARSSAARLAPSMRASDDACCTQRHILPQHTWEQKRGFSTLCRHRLHKHNHGHTDAPLALLMLTHDWLALARRRTLYYRHLCTASQGQAVCGLLCRAACLVVAGGDGPLKVRAEALAVAQQVRPHIVEQRVQLQEVVLDGRACSRARLSSQ